LPSCHMQSISGFSPEKDCIGNRPWKIREPWGWHTDSKNAGNKEELQFTGSFWMISCFRRQEDRGEGRTSSGTGCTCCGNE
jgi:hypothetical protein